MAIDPIVPCIFDDHGRIAMIAAKMRKYISQDVALRIYKTMILPVVEYGDILYGGTNKKPTLHR